MKLVKSLLLGTAAGIAAVAGAQAADLPSRKAAPVEYVRVCTAYGAGFFYIPGTDTCLRVGGRVRAEMGFAERWSRGGDGYGTRSYGRIQLDARTQTAFGTLRAFIRHDIYSRSAFIRGGSRDQFYGAVTGAEQDQPAMDKAFIQFGPITAGKAQSFFDFYASDLGFKGVINSDHSPNLFAYTATFGGGFSATLSLEDPSTSVNRGAIGGLRAEGNSWPDVVASLRVDQGWGSAQLAGVIANRGTYNVVAGGGVIGNRASTDDTGWAIEGGVKLNLPMLAAGDYLWIQGTYADGALGYLGVGSTSMNLGRLVLGAVPDYVINPVTGSLKSSSGYSVLAALRHYWTPTIRQELYAAYTALDVPATGAFLGDARKVNPKLLQLGTAVIWSPVAGLDLGVEVLYQRLETGRRVADAKLANFGLPQVGIKSEDAFQGRLRIQRDF